jgi:hypothetical protein
MPNAEAGVRPPLKALRLMGMDMNSGIEIFSHTWQEGQNMAGSELLSGMLQGISMLMKESVDRGELRDIHLDRGYLIVKRSEEFLVAPVSGHGCAMPPWLRSIG